MRFLLLVFGLMGLLLLMFFAVDRADITLLTNPGPALAGGGIAAATLSFSLLVVDVFLPVPSSLVMVANGSLFGLAAGTLLSTAGGFAATMVAFGVGRKSRRLLTVLVSDGERATANGLLNRWGDLGLVLTRPIPIVAETVALIAGTAPGLSVGRTAVAALVGSIPHAFIYAWLGARAVELDSAWPILTVVLVVAGVYWLIGRLIRTKR